MPPQKKLDQRLSYGLAGLIDEKVIRPMKTKTKRKKHRAAFQAQVGMEAMLGIKTGAQSAREQAGHPVQVRQGKTVIRERWPELFDRGGPAGEESRKRAADLHQKIGELTVDLDYLKKSPGNWDYERAAGTGGRAGADEPPRARRAARYFAPRLL